VYHLLREDWISEQALKPLMRDFREGRGSQGMMRTREPFCTFETFMNKENRKKGDDLLQKLTLKSLKIGEKVSSLKIPVELGVPDYVSVVVSLIPWPQRFESLTISRKMPYFHFQSLKQVGLWGDPEARMKALTDRWTYCSGNDPEIFEVYMPMTLDEYCCPTLPRDVLNKRIEDQVLVRIEKNKLGIPPSEPPLEETKVIAVSQAWIWNIQTRVIVSPSINHEFEATTHRELETASFAFPYRQYDERELSCNSGDPLRKIGILLSYLVGFLERPFEKCSPDPILNCFEKALTLISEKVQQYVKDIAVTNLKIEVEKAFLHEISDLQEELSMIRRVLTEQEDVWREFANNAWHGYWPTGRDGRMVIPKMPNGLNDQSSINWI